jgi:hypothetical protein
MLREVGTIVLALAVAGLNLAYWWAVVTRWQEPFRRRCERRFGVSIGTGPRGHWRVSGGSALRNFAIEWLQLVYFFGAFCVWGLGMLACVGVLSLIAPW